MEINNYIRKTVEDFHRSKLCEGCRQNPEATKPYKKMNRLNVDTKFIEMFKKMGVNPSCAMCYSVVSLTGHKEDVLKTLDIE